jgi:hypothetical protein
MRYVSELFSLLLSCHCSVLNSLESALHVYEAGEGGFPFPAKGVLDCVEGGFELVETGGECAWVDGAGEISSDRLIIGPP